MKKEFIMAIAKKNSTKQSFTKSLDKEFAKPGAKPFAKPAGKSNAKSGLNSGPKKYPKQSDKPFNKATSRPAGKSFGKPFGKSAEGDSRGASDASFRAIIEKLESSYDAQDKMLREMNRKIIAIYEAVAGSTNSDMKKIEQKYSDSKPKSSDSRNVYKKSR